MLGIVIALLIIRGSVDAIEHVPGEVGMPSVETKVESQAFEQTQEVGLDVSKDEVPNDNTEPSAARIKEIDISKPASILGILRLSDYVLVFLCGKTAVNAIVGSMTAAFKSEVSDAMILGALTVVMTFAAYTGWRHVGVIDQRVWGSYLWMFPLLAITSLVILIPIGVKWFSQGHIFDDSQLLVSAITWLMFLGVSIIGFACIVSLRTMRISAASTSLVDLLSGLTQGSRLSKLRLKNSDRNSLSKGLAFGIFGGGLMIASVFAQVLLPADKYLESSQDFLTLEATACTLLIYSRRYFQVNADSILARDKRPPILFLRSFSDEEKELFDDPHRSLLDFSLETRLANHFYRFGPFIAIGSPKESIPQIGAARVILPDDVWQPRVLCWMKEASTIVMYSGATEWVNWELHKIVECGRANSLILLMPEVKAHGKALEDNIQSRVNRIREVCKGTPWNEELIAYGDFVNLRAMLFCEDGSMVMIKSESYGRDAYHLAALVAHHLLLRPANTSAGTVCGLESNELPWRTALAWTLSGVLVLGAGLLGVGLYWLTVDDEPKLTFKQSELYYSKSVTQTEASNVGEYLVRQGFFTDKTAVTVKLSQKEGHYQLGFVVDPAHSESLLLAIQFSAMGTDMGREVLSGKPVDVELYDQNLKLIKTLPWSAKLMYGKGELYYTDPIGLSEAQKLGEWLRQNGFFTETKATAAHFGREQEVYQLRFVIDPSRLADPQISGAFIEFSRAIAEQVLGGSALLVHLCDQEFHTLKSERVEPISAVQHQ